MTSSIRLVSYVRVSKVGGRGGESFQSPDQQAEAIAHAVALKPGARIVQQFTDLDESGGKMSRPEFDKALAMLAAGEADGIVVAKLDRFARTSKAIPTIRELVDRGQVFISAADSFDTSTPTGRFTLGMMMLVAELELERYVESWSTATANATARGVHTTVPYGYRRADGKGSKLAPDPDTAPVVRRIFAARLDGLGVASIAGTLNDERIAPPGATRTPPSTHWTRQTVRALIRTRTYLGEASYKGHAVHAGAHEALVSEADWTKAQPAKGERRPKGGGSLLAGLVRCAGCGYVMGAGGDGAGNRRYSCGRHTGAGDCPSPTTAPAERLEGLVEAAFLERHAGGYSLHGHDQDPAAADAVERLQREFIRWRDDSAMRDALGDEDYRAGLLSRKADLDTAVEQLAATVAEHEALTLVVDAAEWQTWSVPQRRDVLRADLEHVVVRRAASTHAPLAGRVELGWIAAL